MGWRPSELYSVSVSEFWAAWIGFTRFHAPPQGEEPLTRVEFDAVLRERSANGQ